MQKQKLINKKRIFLLAISLLLILMGIGCIIWSIINIRGYSTYRAEGNIKNNIDETSTTDNSVENVIIYNRSIYKVYPAEGDYIGTINIPVLDITYSIYEGTSSAELKKGVGHFIQSALPGETNNSVISGHRDTVFKDIGKLIIGDKIIITTSAGVFTYEVNGTRIVELDDKTVIVSTEEAILTMTTCYPFHYVGPAPKRYIVSSVLIQSE